MTKFSKVLFLGAAALCIASTAAVASDYNRNSRNYNRYESRNTAWFNDNSAPAPQVQSTRAGNPHRDAGSAMPANKLQRQFPSEPTAQDANAVSRPTTKAGDPHRDPANANSAYFNARADMSEHDSAASKMRMSNRQVRAVQENLSDRGYRLASDGVWGPKTAKAVRNFQADNNLQPTGRLDNETIRALNTTYRANDARVDAYGNPVR